MRESRSASDTAGMPAAEHDTGDRFEEAKAAERERQQRIDDLLWLMSDKRGRRVVWRLLEGAGIYRSTFTGDALTSAFREGERNQGLRLMDQVLQHCPDRVSEMQKEARQNERRKGEGKAG